MTEQHIDPDIERANKFNHIADSDLTEWERGFAETVRKFAAQGRGLSDKQRAIADRILTKLAGKIPDVPDEPF